MRSGKTVFLVLTLTGQATMWMAVFADMGASLLVVFNDWRHLQFKIWHKTNLEAFRSRAKC